MIEIGKLLEDHQAFHSDFQIDYAILARSGGTPYGIYRQALREIDSRYRSLIDLRASLDLLGIEIEEAEGLPLWKRLCRQTTRRRRTIELDQKRRAAWELSRTIRETERELTRFYGHAAALKEDIGELTPERRAVLDREMWRHQLKAMAAVDLFTQGALGRNTIEFIMGTPRHWRDSLMHEIQDHKRLKQWFLEYEPPLPAIGGAESALPDPGVVGLGPRGLFEGIMALEIAERRQPVADLAEPTVELEPEGDHESADHEDGRPCVLPCEVVATGSSDQHAQHQADHDR